jgi:hypothetical protein
MPERQHEIHTEAAVAGTSGTSNAHQVVVELVDGTEVRLSQVQGTETIADVRQAVLDQVEVYTEEPGAYVVTTRAGRPVQPGTTIDQMLAEGEVLEFLLLKPAAFGSAVDTNADA